jgi:hypothetical protein
MLGLSQAKNWQLMIRQLYNCVITNGLLYRSHVLQYIVWQVLPCKVMILRHKLYVNTCIRFKNSSNYHTYVCVMLSSDTARLYDVLGRLHTELIKQPKQKKKPDVSRQICNNYATFTKHFLQLCSLVLANVCVFCKSPESRCQAVKTCLSCCKFDELQSDVSVYWRHTHCWCY